MHERSVSNGNTQGVVSQSYYTTPTFTCVTVFMSCDAAALSYNAKKPQTDRHLAQGMFVSGRLRSQTLETGLGQKVELACCTTLRQMIRCLR